MAARFSRTVYHLRQASSRPSGVSKPSKHIAEKCSKSLDGVDQYFWYTSLDSVRRLVTSSEKSLEPPLCINSYVLDPTKFARREFSKPQPSNVVWPPHQACEVLRAIVSKSDLCVGGTAFSAGRCRRVHCQHTFEEWTATMADWQDHFELRETEGRCIGVYTKRAFPKGDTLGYYAGEVIPDCLKDDQNDYLVDVPFDFVAFRRSSSCSTQSGSDNKARALSTHSEASSLTADLAADGTVTIDGRRK